MRTTSGFSVPFEISEINHGLKKASGLIKLIDKGFSLEFEVEDVFFGLLKSGIQHVQIDYNDLDTIEYKKGWMGDKIVLEGKSMQVFNEIPGTEVATCILKIKRKDREEAQSLVSNARLQLSEAKLNQMGGG